MNGQVGRGIDVWEKWDWLWTAVFYGSVLASAGLMLLDDNRATPAWVALLLTGVLLLWHWAGLKLAYKDISDWEDRASLRFIILLVDAVLWFVLVSISPAYYVALFGLFSQAFRQLPVRYAAITALLLIAGIVIEQVTGSNETLSLSDPLLWIFLLLAFSGVILGIWISAIIGQSTRRRELIEQLEATQAELAAAERREGMLEERQRLAREIHDTLAQGFISIVMHLEAADQALPDDLEALQKHLDQARSTARANLDEARRVVQDLRPDLLEEGSLMQAIERVGVRWSNETGISLATVTTGRPVDLHPDVEVILLRATQEALSNVRKYAQATAVQVTLSYMDDMVILDIQDDGVGLDGAEPSPLTGGYGLQAMRERAEQCGGMVLVESEPGEGTTIVVSIPLDQDSG